MTYVTLKVDPPLRPRAARMAEAANQGGSRVLPLWLGPWLPASQRNVA